MIELRRWVLAHAPTAWNGLIRVQELHNLNNELNYQIYRKLWPRALAIPFITLLVCRIFKRQLLNLNNQDSFEGSYKQSHAQY